VKLDTIYYASNGAGLHIVAQGREYATNLACFPGALPISAHPSRNDAASVQLCSILDGHGGIVPQFAGDGIPQHSAGYKAFGRRDVEIADDSPLAHELQAAMLATV